MPWRLASALLSVLMVGCFSPDYQEGIQCSWSGTCPGSLVCNPADERCYHPVLEPSCDDRWLDGDESDVDCGGSCSPCALEQACRGSADCQSQSCQDGVCARPRCGDGAVNQASEMCDTGGESVTCDGDCTPSVCGDGTRNESAGEDCDEAGESAVCNLDCTLSVCGDGTLNTTAGENCDTGGESASCDVDCSPVACGDLTVNGNAGEQCDDGGIDTDVCNRDCTVVTCGDGIHNMAAGEQCDDGNLLTGDGCDDTCRLEYLASCKAILDMGWSTGDGVYTIDTDGYGVGDAPMDVYCDMTSDGGGWTRIFYEDTTNDTYFLVDEFERERGNPLAIHYAILNDLERFRRNGELEFLMRWPGHPTYTGSQQWAQASNPVLDAPGDLPTGYRPISILYTDNGWSLGLQRSLNPSVSLLDGTISPLGNWYYAVGTTYCWGNLTSGCQPAPSGGAHIAELLVR